VNNWNIQTIEAFVQQLAVGCIAHGYWFYVIGTIPSGKSPLAVDAKLVDRYGPELSRWTRARRKRAGLANLRYMRHGHFFVLLATHGEHTFFECEPFHDVRRNPIRFAGYSIGCGRGIDGRWHASVRMDLDQYRTLKGYFLEVAAKMKVEDLALVFHSIPVEPYAPVRRQLLNILRAVNRIRRPAGLQEVPVQALRLRRQPCRVFDVPEPAVFAEHKQIPVDLHAGI